MEGFGSAQWCDTTSILKGCVLRLDCTGVAVGGEAREAASKKGPVDPVEGPHFYHLVSVALKWLREDARVCPLGGDWVRVQAGVLPCAGEGRQQGRSRNDPRSCLICVSRPPRTEGISRYKGGSRDFRPGVRTGVPGYLPNLKARFVK